MGGGSEQILCLLLNALDKDKYEIEMMEFSRYSIKMLPFAPNIKQLRPMNYMDSDPWLLRFVKLIAAHFFPGILHSLYINKNGYDIEIAFNHMIPSFIVSRGRNKKICWIHGSVAHLKKTPVKRCIQACAFGRADKIVTISDSNRKAFLELFPRYESKLVSIYNGFDLDLIRRRAEEYEADVMLPSVCFIGRMEQAKNPLALIEVCEALKRKGYYVNFYFLGTGPFECSCAEKAELLGVSDRVHILGYVENPYPLIKKCIAVCMLSESEGFPTVFAEGMALGVPFISHPVGGTDELCDNGRCGIIVNSPGECAESICSLIDDEEKRRDMSRACREHIEQFSIEAMKNSAEELFDSL